MIRKLAIGFAALAVIGSTQTAWANTNLLNACVRPGRGNCTWT
ncbi:hypothetical protein ACU4GD_39325 [Cupriavidus basilensis]